MKENAIDQRTREANMVAKLRTSAAEAVHGEKMIEVRVRFWTNDIAKEDGKVIPKHAWSGGVVRMEPNRSHGIRARGPVTFNSLMELNAVIEKVLIAHGVVLHPSDKMSKYFDTEA